MFYPELMSLIHEILGYLNNEQKRELKANFDEYESDIKEFLKENEFYLDLSLAKEIHTYNREFGLKSGIFLKKDKLVDAIYKVFKHYYTNRVEPDKSVGVFVMEVIVRGTDYIPNLDEILKSLKPGDKLELIPEPKNPYDKNAIKVANKGQKIGYIPKERNKELHRLLELDYEIFAVLKRYDFEKVKILVYLDKDKIW